MDSFSIILDRLWSHDEIVKKNWENIKPNPKVEITSVMGVNICGKRGELQFHDIIGAKDGRWLQEIAIEEKQDILKETKTKKEENILEENQEIVPPEEIVFPEIEEKIKKDETKDVADENASEVVIPLNHRNQENTAESYIQNIISLESSPDEIDPIPTFDENTQNNTHIDEDILSSTSTTVLEPQLLQETKSSINSSQQNISSKQSIYCPKNYKLWGSPNADGTSPYWIPSSKTCPINYINIISSKTQNLPSDYKKIHLNPDFDLIFTTEGEDLPIVSFVLTEGLPWVHPNEVWRTPGREFYPLIKDLQNENLGCLSGYMGEEGNENFDSRYDLIVSTDEETLFKENGIWCKTENNSWFSQENLRYNGNEGEKEGFTFKNILNFTKNLPLFEKYDDMKSIEYNLYARHYAPWDRISHECLKDGSINLATENKSYNQDIGNHYISLYLIGIGGCIFVLSSFITLLLIGWFCEGHNRKRSLIGMLNITLICVFIFFLLTYSGITYILMKHVQTYQSELKHYSENNWSDNFMKALLLSYVQEQAYIPQKMWHTLYNVWKALLTGILLIFYTMITIVIK